MPFVEACRSQSFVEVDFVVSVVFWLKVAACRGAGCIKDTASKWQPDLQGENDTNRFFGELKLWESPDGRSDHSDPPKWQDHHGWDAHGDDSEGHP